jgi:hypothetical protein
VRLPGEHQQDDQDPGSRDRDLHRSASDVSHDRLRHKQFPTTGIGRTRLLVPHISAPKHAGEPDFRLFFAEVTRNRTFGKSIHKCTYCSVITVQHWLGPGQGLPDRG